MIPPSELNSAVFCSFLWVEETIPSFPFSLMHFCIVDMATM